MELSAASSGWGVAWPDEFAVVMPSGGDWADRSDGVGSEGAMERVLWIRERIVRKRGWAEGTEVVRWRQR